MIVSICKNKDVNTIISLLKEHKIHPDMVNNYILKWSAYNGYLDVIRLLLVSYKVDVRPWNDVIVKCILGRRCIEMLKLFLKYSDIDLSSDNNHFLRYATKDGREDIVKITLKCAMQSIMEI